MPRHYQHRVAPFVANQRQAVVEAGKSFCSFLSTESLRLENTWRIPGLTLSPQVLSCRCLWDNLPPRAGNVCPGDGVDVCCPPLTKNKLEQGQRLPGRLQGGCLGSRLQIPLLQLLSMWVSVTCCPGWFCQAHVHRTALAHKMQQPHCCHSTKQELSPQEFYPWAHYCF